MKRKLLVLLLIVAAGALLLPSLASPVDEDPDAGLHNDIEMSPSDGPNGVYAILDENDEIAIKITEERQEAAEWEGGTGVSDDTVTEIDEIFDIAYSDKEEARVWLDETKEGITFYVGDDPENSIEGESNHISLEEGEVVSVGLLIDTSVDDHEVEEVSNFGVNAEVSESDSGGSAVTVTAGDIQPSFESVTVNESGLDVTATVENVGDISTDDTVSLSVDDEEVATKPTTELTGGSSERIQFEEALSLTPGEEIELQLETSSGNEVMTTEVAPDDEGTENESEEDESDDEEEADDDEKGTDDDGEETDDEGVDEDDSEAETPGETETGADADSVEDDEAGGDTPSSPDQDNPPTETLAEFSTLTVLLLLAGAGAGAVAAMTLRRRLSSE